MGARDAGAAPAVAAAVARVLLTHGSSTASLCQSSQRHEFEQTIVRWFLLLERTQQEKQRERAAGAGSTCEPPNVRGRSLRSEAPVAPDSLPAFRSARALTMLVSAVCECCGVDLQRERYLMAVKRGLCVAEGGRGGGSTGRRWEARCVDL